MLCYLNYVDGRYLFAVLMLLLLLLLGVDLNLKETRSCICIETVICSLNYLFLSCSSPFLSFSSSVADFSQGSPNKADPNGFLLPVLLPLKEEGSFINGAETLPTEELEVSISSVIVVLWLFGKIYAPMVKEL